jgi:hypothetical protein
MARITKITIDEESPWKHEPGSPDAVREGCTCSQAFNNGGKGVMHVDGPHFSPSITCPMHGISVVIRAGHLKPATTMLQGDARPDRQRRRR